MRFLMVISTDALRTHAADMIYGGTRTYGGARMDRKWFFCAVSLRATAKQGFMPGRRGRVACGLACRRKSAPKKSGIQKKTADTASACVRAGCFLGDSSAWVSFCRVVEPNGIGWREFGAQGRSEGFFPPAGWYVAKSGGDLPVNRFGCR